MEASRADLYDAFLGRHEQAREIASFIDRVASRRLGDKEGELLDIGCGTGRMLGPLAELGFTVTGREPDADYLARARARAPEGVTVERGGFEDLAAEDRYAMCVAINGPFGYLLNVAHRRGALANVHRALVRGGVLLLDLANFLYLLRNGDRTIPPQEVVAGGRRILRRTSHEHDFDQATWIHHDELTIEGAAPRRETFRFAMLSAPEVRAMLEDAGFEHIETHSAWSSPTPTRAEGARMILTARKPWTERDPLLRGDALRAAVHEGRIFRFRATPESRALAERVADLAREALGTNDLARAHEVLEPEALQSRLDAARRALRETRDLQERALQLAGIATEPGETAIDALRLRAVLPGAHHLPEAAPAYVAHRDTWYASPRAQLNWWLPLQPVPADRALALHTRYFDRHVRNDSHAFDYDTFVRTIGWQRRPPPGVRATYPAALQALTGEPERPALDAAELLLFSAAQLHQTQPNTSDEIRWSIDFRTVHLLDHARGAGAPNVDGNCKGSALADYAQPARSGRKASS